MLTIGTAGSSEYYTAASYYAEGNERSGWHGLAKEAAGLKSGPVTPEDLRLLLAGKSADGVPLTPHVEKGLTHSPGLDLTFSVPKALSILAQGPEGERFRQIIWRANHTAMSVIESDVVQTRLTDPDTGKRVYPTGQKIIYASFMEDTSRAGDPNIHIHNVTPNCTMGPDGKFRAMHNAQIFDHRNLMGGVFRADLAKGLREMGLNLKSLEKDGHYKDGLYEVAGVSEKAMLIFSKRREQMKEIRKETTHKEGAMDRIVLISRPKKEVLPPTELRARWDKELNAIGQSFEKIRESAFAMTPQITASPEKTLTNLISDMSETKRAWTKFDLYRQAFMRGVPQISPAELHSAIDGKLKRGELVRNNKFYTTPNILRREKTVVQQLEAGRLKGKVFAETVPRFYGKDSPSLTEGQHDAAALIVSARDRIIGVQGTAGAGKTTLLMKALPKIKEARHKLIGIAPSSAAVEELEKTGMFDQVMTSQRFVMTPAGDKKTVLVIDESSLIGTKSMLSILQYANSRKLPKVILMGDINQHKSVEAGTPFMDLQRAGMQTAKVDEIVRQNNPRHRTAINHLARGQIREGLLNYAPEIHQVEASSLVEKIVELWRKTKDSRTPIIVLTNKQKQDANIFIKESLDKTPDMRAHKVWRYVNATPSEKSLIGTYEQASHIRFNKQLKRFGIKSGEIYKIDSIDNKGCAIVISNERRKTTFLPAKYKLGKNTVELYRQDTIELQANDRIRFTRGGKKRAVNNNDIGTITKLTQSSVEIELDKGKTLALPLNAPELRHLDYGWATTSHAFQGRTVPHAVALMPSRKSPLTTLESLYTSSSRHKDGVAIVTDDVERLQKSIETAVQVNLEHANVFKPNTPAIEQALHEIALNTEPKSNQIEIEKNVKGLNHKKDGRAPILKEKAQENTQEATIDISENGYQGQQQGQKKTERSRPERAEIEMEM